MTPQRIAGPIWRQRPVVLNLYQRNGIGRPAANLLTTLAQRARV